LTSTRAGAIGAGYRAAAGTFFARDPNYDRGITVPAIVDIPTGQVVTNDFAQITLDLSTEWQAYRRPGAPDLYPEEKRAEIDEVAELVYRDVNNGVYQAGFAASQDAYEKAYAGSLIGWIGFPNGCRISVIWSATQSPRLTCGYLPRWPVRRRLSRAFQMQSPKAERDAGAVGVRA